MMLVRLLTILFLISTSAFADGKATFDRLLASPTEKWQSILDLAGLTPTDIEQQADLLAQMVRSKQYEQAVLQARALDMAAATVLHEPPTENHAQVTLALALQGMGERKLAHTVSKNLKALAPDSANSLFVQGVLMVDLNPVAAANLLNQARAANLHPDYQEQCLQSLMIAYAVQHKMKEVEKTAKELLALNPKNGMAQDVMNTLNSTETVEAKGVTSDAAMQAFDKAEAAFAKGDYAAALKLYDQAIAASPRFVKAHIYKGDALLSLGDLDKAIACYRTALTIDPRDKQAHRFLGDTLHRKYVQTGDRKLLTEAISHFETALQIDPNYAMARDSLAAARQELGGR